MAPGIVMPAGGAKLPDGLDRGGRRIIAPSADLGRLRAAGIAQDADVSGLDELERHGGGRL
jgi:hypothetical protein